MEKLLLEPEARFKFERLCDSWHPEEVGGYFLGIRDGDNTIIKDVFPVPNTAESSKKRNTYGEHSWGDFWSQLYGKTVRLDILGKFHSHPNGSIPSTNDMKACPGLHIWLIHHKKGEHTFLAGRDYVNREVMLLNEPHEEIIKPHLKGDRLMLGISYVASSGVIHSHRATSKILTLKNESRRILLLGLQNRRYGGRINVDEVVIRSGKSRATVRKHLNFCIEAGLLEKGWSRGEYRIKDVLQ